MPGLVPAIHVFELSQTEDVDARHLGERSDAVLRTAMAGHDECGLVYALMASLGGSGALAFTNRYFFTFFARNAIERCQASLAAAS
jgi:hypothetical protein